MKKLFILIMAALPMFAMAQTNVNVDAAGTLATQLGDQKFKISDMKISGSLNGNDLKLLQDIVTRSKIDKKNPGECLVTSVDLSGVTIVASNEGLKVSPNELPKGLFSGAKNLTKVVLPSSVSAISKECFSN